jgi:hypothetical protein
MTAPIDTQLRDYSEYFETLLEEVAVEDVLTERVSEGPVQPLRPRTPAVRRGWLAAAGAVAIVAAIIGLVGLFRSTDTEPTPPATNLPPTTESIAPQLRSSGVIDTPLGNVAWSYYTGPSGPGSSLFEGPDGELAMWLADEEILWTSADGVAWESASLPVPVDAEVLKAHVLGDSYWLSTSNPTTLWRSDDFRSWEEIDLSAVRLPDSFNMGWTLGLGPMAHSDGGVVATWTAWPKPPLESWLPALAESHTDFHLDRMGIFDPAVGQPVRATRLDDGVDETVAVIRIEPWGGGWRVFDAESDAELAYFAFGPERVASPFTYSVEGLLLVDANGTAESLTPVWLDPGGSVGGLVHIDGRILALSLETGEVIGALWESRDGRDWEPLGRPPFMPPGTGGAMLWEDGGVLYGSAESGDTTRRWTSRDGIDWTELRGPDGVPPWDLRLFGSGFAAWADEALLLSADSTTWEPVYFDELGFAIDTPAAIEGFPGGVVGDRLVLRFWPGDQPGGQEPGIQFVVLQLSR